jgi:hypothetical protein
VELLEDRHIVIQICRTGEGQVCKKRQKSEPLRVAQENSGKQLKRKTLGSGLNAGNIGAEIDVIQPALPAQTHALIAIHFAFGVSRTSFLDRLARFARLALQNRCWNW